jgi:hypothetical protein
MLRALWLLFAVATVAAPACAQGPSADDADPSTTPSAEVQAEDQGGGPASATELLPPGRYDCYGILGASTGGAGSYVWIVGFDLTPNGTYVIDDEEHPYRYDAGSGEIEWQGGSLEGHRTSVTPEWINIAFEENGAEAECERP